MDKLSSIECDGKRVSALFLPGVEDLYPDGIEQDVNKQRGTFVEVVGYSQEMEGASRPTFFRGVATVVTKLFNIVQPDLTFFGQKDIQQCLILRRMVSDLHLPHPPSPSHLRIVPTVRDHDNLALSSRNAYLSTAERKLAPILYTSLQAAQTRITEALQQDGAEISAKEVFIAAQSAMEEFVAAYSNDEDGSAKVDLALDYIKLNDPLTLRPMTAIAKGQAAVLSGAIKIGKTRLIDNLLVNIQL
ncbi:pantoate-beta-alanine ligase [Cystobasidiomycetes sp. EMM_F5]